MNIDQDFLPALRRIYLFSSVDESTLRELSRSLQPVQLEAGQIGNRSRKNLHSPAEDEPCIFPRPAPAPAGPGL